MKLLVCPKCTDIFNLVLDKEKTCSCGHTKGKYTDKLNAEYEGGVPIAFNNSEFLTALMAQIHEGEGLDFKAFGIRKDCRTFKPKA